jgi:cytoskeletal protein RodZ
MEMESKQDSFGDYLKGFRMQREMGLETVAARTKITVHCLTAMEDNAHDQLPPKAYVKSFIRAYADAVGADANVAMTLYLSDLELQAATRQQRLKRQANLWAIKRVLMALGLIVGILLIVRYTDFFPEPPPTPALSPPEGGSQPALPAAQNPTARRSQPAVTQASKLKLRVVALQRTWLKIIVDDQNVRSYDLKPEDRLELEGTRQFNLMIGDANGLQIFFNDEPVKIYGSSGQVVNLKLP